MTCPETVLSKPAQKSLGDFLAGQNYAYAKHKDRERKYGRRKVVVFDASPTRMISVAGVGEMNGVEMMHITRRFLEEMALLDQARITTLDRDGVLIHVGYPFEILFLIGVEEAYHHLHPELYAGFPRHPWEMSIPKYDAIRAEYLALKFQLKTAIANKFSRQCIETLRHRIIQAERKGVRK